MSGKERILNELQMLTGVLSTDLDYLMYKLLQGGSYFEDLNKAVEKKEPFKYEVDSVDAWFSKLEEL